MFSALIKIAKTPWGESGLAMAICVNNYDAVKLYVERNKNINFLDDSGLSPLFASLIGNDYKIATLLLEHGADPNLISKGEKSSWQGKPIQKYLEPYRFPPLPQAEIEKYVAEYLSVARLLVIHGTTRDNITFYDNNPKAKRVFEESEVIYQQMVEAEKTAKITTNKTEKQQTYNKLNSLWSNLAADETHPIFKQFYQKKAVYYRKLSGDFSQENSSLLSARSSFFSNLANSDSSSPSSSTLAPTHPTSPSLS